MDVTERGRKVYIKVLNNDEKNIENIELSEEKGDKDHANDSDQNDSEISTQARKTCADNCVCIGCLFLVGSVGIGSLSVIFDWLWVADMLRAETGLVFGPPSISIIVALIVMSSLGTVTYFCENGDKIYKFITGKDIFDEQTEELLSLFLEEVPEITLNLLLAMCREIPISYFQLIKAGLAIASSALRLMKATCYALGCKTTKRRRHQLRAFGRVILIAACIYTFATGITVFVFMYMEPKETNQDGRFYAPANVFGSTYNTERYFPNSGVFLSHPSLDQCQQDRSKNHNITGHNNWIRIEVMFTYLLLGSDKMEAVYSYNDTKAMFYVKSRRREHCYDIDLTRCSITPIRPTDCEINQNASTLYLIFHHTPMTNALVYGDVKYNATLTTSGQCSYVTGDFLGRMFHGHNYIGQLQYFKASYQVNTTLPLTYSSNSTAPMFYQYPQQLWNVSKAWRTGFKDCDMSGSLAPNPQPHTQLKCPTWKQP